MKTLSANAIHAEGTTSSSPLPPTTGYLSGMIHDGSGKYSFAGEDWESWWKSFERPDRNGKKNGRDSACYDEDSATALI